VKDGRPVPSDLLVAFFVPRVVVYASSQDLNDGRPVPRDLASVGWGFSLCLILFILHNMITESGNEMNAFQGRTRDVQWWIYAETLMHTHDMKIATSMPCTVTYTDTRCRNTQRPTTHAKGNDPQIATVHPCMAFSLQTSGTVNGTHSELAIAIISTHV
jgi:hypothetical protein